MLKRLLDRFFPQPIVRAASTSVRRSSRAPKNGMLREDGKTFSISEVDGTFKLGTRLWAEKYRDRADYSRDEVLKETLSAWRTNPIARRIVSLTTEYVIGDGFTVQCDHAGTLKFLQDLWNHPLNRLDEQLPDACDELTRAGDLFPIITTDKGGKSYIRFAPAEQINTIQSAPNDIRQERRYLPAEHLTDPKKNGWVNYHYKPKNKTVMLHYAVNKPVGGQFGEPDLGPLVPWLARYAEWLENRARINKFRTAFLYVLTGRFASDEERRAREMEIMGNPLQPGSVLVTDESEEWSILSSKLDAFDANADGLALKKIIAAGAGIPLHYLAEPESSTRTTSEASGTPTFRHFERRQKLFMQMVIDLLTVCVRRAAAAGQAVDPSTAIKLNAPDVTEKDNAALALATNQVTAAAMTLFDAGMIDSKEVIRLIYRFAGEVEPDSIGEGERAPRASKPANAGGIHVDPKTGDTKTDADSLSTKEAEQYARTILNKV